MRASSNASKPHSYGATFSLLSLRGPSKAPMPSSATPMPPATNRNRRIGRYSASTGKPWVLKLRFSFGIGRFLRAHAAHHAKIGFGFFRNRMQVDAHQDAENEKCAGQHRGRTRQERRRTTRAEHGRRGAAAETGTGLRSGATLQQDQ